LKAEKEWQEKLTAEVERIFELESTPEGREVLFQEQAAKLAKEAEQNKLDEYYESLIE